MTPLSSRFAWAILGIALLAGLPVAIHTLRLADKDDCVHPDLLHPLAFSRVADLEKLDKPLPEMAVSDVRGSLADAGSTDPLRFRIARSYDPSTMITAPHGGLGIRIEVERKELTWLERGETRIPVHWVSQSSPAGTRFATYFFVYDREPVASPRTTVLTSGFQRVFTGGRPLTLFSVGGTVRRQDEAKARADSEAWLLSAWDQYQTACRP